MAVMRWIFSRDAERLELQRPADDQGVELSVVRQGDAPRTYAFADARARARFQVDMEALLVATGWLLVAFEPERRRGRDRRRFPRLEERRRWWTDPPPTSSMPGMVSRAAGRRR